MSVLDYCSIVYITASKNLHQKVQKNTELSLSNYFICRKEDTYLEMHNKLNLDECALHNFCVILFKCMHNMVPNYLKNLLMCMSTLDQQFQENQMPQGLAKKAGAAFYIRGLQAWNTSPNDLRSVTNLNKFNCEIFRYCVKLPGMLD